MLWKRFWRDYLGSFSHVPPNLWLMSKRAQAIFEWSLELGSYFSFWKWVKDRLYGDHIWIPNRNFGIICDPPQEGCLLRWEIASGKGCGVYIQKEIFCGEHKRDKGKTLPCHKSFKKRHATEKSLENTQKYPTNKKVSFKCLQYTKSWRYLLNVNFPICLTSSLILHSLFAQSHPLFWC